MRISLKWLSDYVSLPPAEELARRLTGVGLEVEAVEQVGANLAGVVTARVVSAEKHPEAEKLSIVRVDAGTAEPLQIVCGAQNWQVGDVVPLATIGAKLPGGMEIQKARLRGVDSFGMLCSAKELELSEDASGLLLLPRDLKPGRPLAEALGIEDTVFEVNVTPNRPDCLSHVGIAREVAAFLGEKVRYPQSAVKKGGGPASAAVKVRIEAPEKCYRYAARVIEGVRLGPSPLWLARRLEACGVRSICNVVDATNYVALELGHPLHAFDLDKVAGGEIIVRTARAGERMITLDGQERTLDPDDLVIADRDRASALAGVMGGGDSEISESTTRVLLEAAWFQPQSVRRTAKRHGLRTEASHRMERGIDPCMLTSAIDRCAAMIAELGGGTVRQGIVDAHPRRHRPATVRLAWSRPSEILGMPVGRAQARAILESLGFRATKTTPRDAVFQVPSWRADVSREEDLVEEIARSVGYDQIPETLPAAANEPPADAPAAQAVEQVRRALETAGFSEAVNFSFVAPADLQGFTPPGEAPIALKNPISADMAVMRTSLAPSLLRNLAYNLRQRVEEVRLYEIASVYCRQPPEAAKDLPAREEQRLGAGAYGRRSPVGWAETGERMDFGDIKAALERVLDGLGIADVRFSPGGESWQHPRSACTVEAVAPDGTTVALGSLGELHPRVAARLEVPRGVYVLDCSVEALIGSARLVPSYRPIPRLPAVLRDLAVVVDDGVPVAQVLTLVRSESLVEDVRLFDVYRGAPIPPDKKNLAMAIRYRASDRTLTDAEADAAHARIVERLRSDPDTRAELRG
jgi:phenylalanyl-tRNA synthetase beta chain